MVEKTKTAYINYEDDLKNYFYSLQNFYQEHPYTKRKFDKHTEFLCYFVKINEIIKILINKNKIFLECDCVFQEENNEIFFKIPNTITDIIINALSGKISGFSEIILGLKMLKLITNSSLLINQFVDKCGVEALYNLILNRELSNVYVKQLILENIYRLITHKKAFMKLLENLDKNKFQSQYFMIKENVRDRDLQYEEFEENDKKDIKKSKKKAKGTKYSRNSSEGSHSSDDSLQMKRKKTQAKNILLKNGYQIILTLIIGKKNNCLINIIRKILNKIGFQLYLFEILETSNTIVNILILFYRKKTWIIKQF